MAEGRGRERTKGGKRVGWRRRWEYMLNGVGLLGCEADRDVDVDVEVEGGAAESECGKAVEGVRGTLEPHICAAMLVRRWWRRERMTGPVLDDGRSVAERVDAPRLREREGGSMVKCLTCNRYGNCVDSGRTVF
jgi:hypothetical protein